ncbi:MAG: two-component sensor histidine kinase [Labilithrix sp.]|nr:two-component sensor histidine kinase [Labilithrix sp.]
MEETDDRLSNRLAWITGLRLGFLTLLLVATAFFYLRGQLALYPTSQGIVFFTIGGAFAQAAAYATWLRSRKNLRRLAELQIVADQITWTAIVYVSGGPTSGATSFYGLTCLVGAILIGLRGATLASVSGIAIFTMLCAALGFGWISPPRDQSAANYVVTLEGIVYPLAVNALGIVVVALLAGYLAERLRRTGGQLAIAQERALAAERLAILGRIAAGLAHEIRNPLGSISGSIEMLRDAPGLTEEDRRLCDIVHREAARLNHLVSDMMDLARPKKPEPEDVDVGALAREVVELASRSERSGSGDVTVVYEGPEGAVLARCDAAQMRQVLWNLVRNGVQATGAGTKVVVSIAVASERIELAVTDEGPGISPETKEKIFDAFFTTRSHGAGIGLAVVRRIVEDHASLGVTIDVRAAPTGATFVLGLARADAPGRRNLPARSPQDPAVTVGANGRSRTAES